MQLASSDQSLQSLSPSHTQEARTHRPELQLYSSSRHRCVSAGDTRCEDSAQGQRVREHPAPSTPLPLHTATSRPELIGEGGTKETPSVPASGEELSISSVHWTNLPSDTC